MVHQGERGLTTIEVLLALVIFALGALGVAGTSALAWRIEQQGEARAAAARRGGTVLDSLRGTVQRAGERCAGLIAGHEHTGSLDLEWTPVATAGGRDVHLAMTLRGPGSTYSETAWTFLSCE